MFHWLYNAALNLVPLYDSNPHVFFLGEPALLS
jgi:hypothetical protein